MAFLLASTFKQSPSCSNEYVNRKLPSIRLPINCTTHTVLVPIHGYVVQGTQVRASTTQSTSRVSLTKDMSSLFNLVLSCTGPQYCRILHTGIGTRDASYNVESCLREVVPHLSDEQSINEDTRGNSYSNLAESSDCKSVREMQRRRKIGLANKGKVPWNKGRKHSAETCERIRQRTRKALSDPKVRKKMSECPRSLSNQTKTKIRTSVRKLWGQRLKWKRSREKFLQIWAESIANAAKRGGSDQQELDWDSYEKMEREIAIQEQVWAAEKAKEKEMARIRAQKARKERLAQKKKEQEKEAKVRGESKTKTRKMSKEEKEELAVNQELNLKARLMKIHKKKPIISQVSSQHHRAWENLDMFRDREQLLKQVPLADQIRLAKAKRAVYVTPGILTTFSSCPPKKRLLE